MIECTVVSIFTCRHVSYSEGGQYTRQFPLIVLTLHDNVSFRQGTRDGQFIVDWNYSGPPHSLVILCRNILVLIEDNYFLSLVGVPTQSTTDQFDYIGTTAAMRPHDSVQQLRGGEGRGGEGRGGRADGGREGGDGGRGGREGREGREGGREG